MRENIENICNEYGIENYTINDDLSVDVDGDVFLPNRKLKKLPLIFRYVSGSFYCYCNKLTSLEGSPIKVGNDFYINDNNLASLEGSPILVGGNFYCHSNKITSLSKSGNKLIGGEFYCGSNLLYKTIDKTYFENFKKCERRELILRELLEE